MKKWRVAVIGRTGKGNYGHGLDKVWTFFDNVDLVAVADEHEKGRAAAAKRLKARSAYADYRKMLDKEKPQIVSVAPRYLDVHRDMVLACARAGASIFLEKPMARDLAEADEMVKACEMHHVKCAIAHQTRYSPRVDRIREMILAGKLGKLVELRGRGKNDHRGGGQDLMVLGTHIMDLIRFFAGDAKSCHSKIFQNGKSATKKDIHEGGEAMGPILGDQLRANYELKDTVQASFSSHKDPASRGRRFGLSIYGTKGIVQLTTGSLPEAWLLEDPSWFPGRSKAAWKPITSKGVGKEEPLKDRSHDQGNRWIVEDLFEAIQKDRQPKGSIYDGRAALEMILAVYESHRQSKEVKIPLENRKHPLKVWASS